MNLRATTLVFVMVWAGAWAGRPANFAIQSAACAPIIHRHWAAETAASPIDWTKPPRVGGVERGARKGKLFEPPIDFAALRRALEDLRRSYPESDFAGYIERLNHLESAHREGREVRAEFISLQREALLANPLLSFEELLLVKRRATSPALGLPRNWESNCSLPRAEYDDELCALSWRESGPVLRTVFKPGGKFVGDVDLHWDGRRVLFSMVGGKERWQVFELNLSGETNASSAAAVPRRLTGEEPDVDNYDACYLPNGRILFTSTAPFVGVPCVNGSAHVANLYVMDGDGGNIRQLCFDQEHNWCPTVMNDGRVLYARWEYTDTPHSNTRMLFTMNPDGTSQAAYLGSGSYWPNSFFYARPIPDHPTQLIAVITGHHDHPRMGELVLFDPAQGRHEGAPAVQRIPGFGKKVDPLIRDGLTLESWPKFLHPWPLSDKYFIVSAKPAPDAPWGIYLADVFDNLVPILQLSEFALLEPIPLRASPVPPVIPDRVDPSRTDALVVLQDVYSGDGLRGVPRGAVKALRLFTYHYAYQGMGGLLGVVGMDGPWDIKRVLGTVPVEADGSARFRVPANVPISIQPLDAEGKALQLMRSWMTAMPGETVQCTGCHDRQEATPVPKTFMALNKPPSEIEPWRGPVRGFSFAREVQPVLDRWCVGCHDGRAGPDGSRLADLRGVEKISDWDSVTPGNGGYAKTAGKFSVSYAELHRYVRRPGIESDFHVLEPLEFHADTTHLVQMLKKGHHGVKLDPESWDRLVTWIDLNTPYHGTWGEEIASPGPQRERRRELLKKYANLDDDPEAVFTNAVAMSHNAQPVNRLEPGEKRALGPRVSLPGWPFDSAEAMQRQRALGAGSSRVIELAPGIAIELAPVPAGEFVMGSEEGPADEQPPFRAQVTQPFWMGKFEISNAQFAVFDPSHDSRVEDKNTYQFGIHGYPANLPHQPVVRVTWEEARAFCEWLSSRTGLKFDLPTEVQWEWACRAGADTPFSFGSRESDFSFHANLADSKLREFASDPYTVDVPLLLATRYDDWIPKDVRSHDGALVSVASGRYAANAWGLHDMHGNVAEWTRSTDAPYPLSEGAITKQTGTGRKIARGGSWRDVPARATSSYRFSYQPWQRVFNVGFRVVCEWEKEERPLTELIDAPLLFVKRHSYTGIHIYDTYYKWPPGGGGIYILENPSAPKDQWKIRPVIDPTTPNTLGVGVYSHPELSWDATRLLFCFKGEPTGNTSIYEIRVDGTELRRVTDPGPACVNYKGSQSGQHDIAPAYLPDGRIVFLSTRLSGLVPCNNTGVAVLHVMNADGSDIHPISVNYVNEFDPAILPDGRILYGRWEYVDKNALTIQSLWTCNPDGTQETAFYANNMVFPEAILDARPVPGSPLVVATLAKHNAPPRGSIAFLDPRLGKNDPRALSNLEHPDRPTHDVGDSCEPWALNENVVLFSGRLPGAKRNSIQMLDRTGRRVTVLEDAEICLHSPMLVKPRPLPAVIPESVDRSAGAGRFVVQDIYQGLPGIKRGEVKSLRVIEETSRISSSTMGGSPYNQTFLVSAALAFSAKNYLGLAPVTEEGSAYFEVPAGRAIYLQALDQNGRLVQSMRTFVQAAPGTTRACVGCHEEKTTAPRPDAQLSTLLAGPPSRLQPESWGGGHLDYPSMVQPILDRHCVRCHGGEQGIEAGLDLTGGWTEYFNISYENLVSRRESQLTASLIAGIDCMNGTALWSSQIFPPRAHGSGAARLAELLMANHGDAALTRSERDLLMAWIDSNGLYHGTWDSTASGCATKGWKETREALIAQMRTAGCLRCHGDEEGKTVLFEEDWINLDRPELSRILRAPLREGGDGFGLAFCRDRKVDVKQPRIRQLVEGYAHAVKPVNSFHRRTWSGSDRSGAPVISFHSTWDDRYQAMLAIIRTGRALALAEPRVDMPGAKIVPGESRQLIPAALPEQLPELRATVGARGVQLSWARRAELSGFKFELYRDTRSGFEPEESKRLVSLTRFDYLDTTAKVGQFHYALVIVSGKQRSAPIRAQATMVTDVIGEDVERFRRYLASRVPARRIEGIQGLAHLKDWSSESAMLRLLDDSVFAVRREALLALARIGTDESVDRLVDLLDDPSWEIRQNARFALRRMTGRDCQDFDPAGWRKWQSSSQERQRELLDIARQAPARGDEPVPGQAAFVPTAPGRRTRARPDVLPPAHRARRSALRALVHLSEPSAEGPLIELLREAQNPPLDGDERKFICEVLERVGSERAIPVLSAEKSDAAAWALGRIGGPEAEAALLSFPKTLATLLALDRLHSAQAGGIHSVVGGANGTGHVSRTAG